MDGRTFYKMCLLANADGRNFRGFHQALAVNGENYITGMIALHPELSQYEKQAKAITAEEAWDIYFAAATGDDPLASKIFGQTA
jgi:hypothetical protein